ncbi:hypothetical protein PIB30_051773, partial [Stylosanthes scabra]|nr:hypothetical protein [Stylosanthes scabra]
MQTVFNSIPKQWICDSCQSKGDTPSPCKVNHSPEWEAPKRKRSPPTPKVKFLPPDEVMKLPPGNLSPKPIPAKFSLLVTRKTYTKSRNVISKSPSLAPKSNHSNSPIALKKPPRNIGVSKNPVTHQHASDLISKGGILSAAEHHNVEKNNDQSIQENLNLFRFLPSSIAAW